MVAPATQLNAARSSANTTSKPTTAPEAAQSKPNVTTTLASQSPNAQSAAQSTLSAKRDAKAAETKASADQAARDAAKNLQLARTLLAKDDLSGARSHLSSALAAQPKNRDAQSLDGALSEREQQRDAALQQARNCESSARWICAWHNAGSAIVMDSGSPEAKRILSLAMHEAEAPKVSANAPATDIVSPRDIPNHH
jgi:hypothetical protein